MKLKRLTALLLSVMMVLSLAACGGGGDTKDDSASGDLSGKEIIIGNITPVTGAQAAYGLAITNSIQLAIDEINAAGGILGATVKLSTKDDQGTPAEAVSGFNFCSARARRPSSAQRSRAARPRSQAWPTMRASYS